ncbi:RDD family protein [Solitalea sp. MAHUQ-68]|uniref:RDD family protein n=1 Tax=Solitalea agri TaxID=2953739 RepID=A0A9X2F2B3_9SPHI|nr:RDD family protein [Solitalea agri]MCO4292890.1 RDD family protein [Solitalea agri]
MSNNITIQTAQNVQLNYELASVGDRILATLIDSLVLMAYFLILVVIFASLGTEPGTALIILLALPLMLYHLAMEIYFNGQTIGKRSMHIQVLKLDGSTPSISDYLLRWMFRLLEISATSGGLALITILVNGRSQRIGDIAAGTTVVKFVNRDEFEDIPLTKVNPNYKVNFPEVATLTDHDITLVQKIINRSLKANNEMMLGPVADKIKTITGIESTLSDYVFLQIVIADYNHLASLS